MRRIIFLFFVLNFMSIAVSGASSLNRLVAKEVVLSPENEESHYFPLPAAIDCDADNLYVLDSRDGEVKVFSKSGIFQYAIGREGKGPGEFSYPSDIDIFGSKIYVADKLNRRIQVMDKKGNFLAAFKVLFYPQGILTLDDDCILVSHLPLTSYEKEKILHCFNGKGDLLWENVDSFCSGDAVYDTFANQVFLERGARGGFCLLRKFNDRNVYLYDRRGGLIQRTDVGKGHQLLKISIPTKPDQSKEIRGFCWQCEFSSGKFYLLLLEYSKEEKDLVPGRTIAVISPGGKVEGYIDLPERLNLFCIDGKTIYGVDTLNSLKIFSVQ